MTASNTVSEQRALPWECLPLSSLKGLGPATQTKLDKLGLRCVRDLLFHLPLRYEDRTRITPIGALQIGVSALVQGRIELAEISQKSRRMLLCRVSDGSGWLTLRFFHFHPRQLEQWPRGTPITCFGEVRHGYYGLEMVHPEHHSGAAAPNALQAGLTPVYPLTDGLHQLTVRKLIAQALALLGEHTLPDYLPDQLRQTRQWPSLVAALTTLHQPNAEDQAWRDQLEQARQRLAYEELLAHQLSLNRLRQGVRRQQAPSIPTPNSVLARLYAQLPFKLTAAQQRVITDIQRDLNSDQPMLRLVQGDVGSGKTVVAAAAALLVLAANWQVALMAPTELLAEQHYRSLSAWLQPLGVRVVSFSGRLKGSARQAALEALALGEVGVAVGTHALFQDQVRFARLGLAIVDEQHRFGVHQRLALRDKGAATGLCPHQLIMTATPIPRTLAMLGYADLDVSVIDELPPGRTPVTTTVIAASRRDEIIARIDAWVARGRQVYWVCTLIEESEALQCEAAEATAQRLSEALPRVRVGLAHGRLKAQDKAQIMQQFKAGELDLLVATTVIEVGVDVPNAGLMVIENAERLGLAQLHQLRGRVGRGPGEAHCLLLYQAPLSATARERLGILRATNDGFRIAEKDLELRGPGEMLGTRQTGLMQFRIADFNRDRSLLEEVHQRAAGVWRDYPDHVQPLIERWLGDALRYAEA